MRSSLLVTIALLGASSSSHAQLIDLPGLTSSWITRSYPKIFWTPSNDLTVGLYYEQLRPPGFDDWDDPPPYRAKLSLDGQLSTSGSKQIELDARLPTLLPNWRFVLNFKAQRRARESYFGLGNQSEFDGSNVNDLQPNFYRADHRRLWLRGEVQRSIVTGLRVLTGFHIERWRVDTLPGASQLALDRAAGTDATIGRNTVEAAWRIGLVYDTRDDEASPHRGVRLQAIASFADSTVSGDLTYSRITISAAGFAGVGDRFVAGARVVAQATSDAPGLGSYYLVETAGRPFEAVGGASSHRGVAQHRYLGKDKLFANLEGRYMVAGGPQIVEAHLVGFLDVGRVFQPGIGDDDFNLSLEDMHVGGGAGVVLALFRTGILGWTVGVGPDGIRTNAQTSWSF